MDRIVTGYPRGEDQAIWEKLGYQDNLLDTAEPFGLWVIESPRDLSDELPLPQCGLPVIYTDNQKPYKQRKVRILNGAHTSFVPAAFQCGYDIVLDAMGIEARPEVLDPDAPPPPGSGTYSIDSRARLREGRSAHLSVVLRMGGNGLPGSTYTPLRWQAGSQ